MLQSRSWWADIQQGRCDIVFVLREAEGVDAIRETLLTHIPTARFVTLSHLTGGAMLSALAGCGYITKPDAPLVLDLVDIYFEDQRPLAQILEGVDGAIPCFTSREPQYSYCQTDEAGLLTRAAEKQVISDQASAGVYLFARAADYLSSCVYAFHNPAISQVRGVYFICPILNHLAATGKRVRVFPVAQVDSLSLAFKKVGL
jgi:hypothetical protein